VDGGKQVQTKLSYGVCDTVHIVGCYRDLHYEEKKEPQNLSKINVVKQFSSI